MSVRRQLHPLLRRTQEQVLGAVSFTARRPWDHVVLVRSLSTTKIWNGKSKGKQGDKSNARPTISSDSSPGPGFDLNDFQAACQTVITKLQKEILDLKAGRQDPNVLNNLKIASEKTNLGTLATVTQKNPKTFLITVYDPVHVKVISAAIAASGQNFNPQPVLNNPTQLTINIPQDSSTTREEKAKALAQRAEQARTQIRFLRGNALKVVKKSLTSLDDQKREEKNVGVQVDKFGKDIDQLAASAKKSMT